MVLKLLLKMWETLEICLNVIKTLEEDLESPEYPVLYLGGSTQRNFREGVEKNKALFNQILHITGKRELGGVKGKKKNV